MDDSIPYFQHILSGRELKLRLGDTKFLISSLLQQDITDYDVSPNFFLPGCQAGSVYCTISFLFDGSMMITKESSELLPIFINGQRIPSEVSTNIEIGDIIVLGSIEYSYLLCDRFDDSHDGESMNRCFIDPSRSNINEMSLEVSNFFFLKLAVVN